MNFTAASTVKDIKDYTGPIDASADLKEVKKCELLKYINHLRTSLTAKIEVIDELKETFTETLKGVTNATASMISKTQELQSTITEIKVKHKSVVPDTRNDQVEPDLVEAEPYISLKEDVLPEELYKDLYENVLPDLNYKTMGDGQRDVCYFGKYNYRYKGGNHDPAPFPPPIKKFMDEILKSCEPNVEASVMVTRYNNQDNYCPSHSDNEWAIGPNSNILTTSFGDLRDIEFEKIGNPGKKVTLPLPPNSLLSFSRASQEHWRHAIPKSTTPKEPRYSLTVRFNSPYNINSTLIIGDSNTKYINFGEGPNCLGKWVPGERIQASRINDIPVPENITPHRNIIIHTGVNDINRFNPKPAEQLGCELQQKIAAILKSYPRTKIFLSPALPTRSYELNNKISDFNERIVSLTKTHHNIILINNTMFLDSNTFLLKDEYSSKRYNDLIHLGGMGVRSFAMSLKSYIMGKNQHIRTSMNYNQAYYSSS